MEEGKSLTVPLWRRMPYSRIDVLHCMILYATFFMQALPLAQTDPGEQGMVVSDEKP